MSVQQAYNMWASQYDSNKNKTRDMEAVALRTVLAKISFKSCLEIGCGTGKNTVWLLEKAEKVLAVDLSEEMLSKAKEKVQSAHVIFKQADITKHWQFATDTYDLISFSLVLEHISNLDHIFKEAAKVLHKGGYVYLGELHPFKQYQGTKARFDTADGRHVVECYDHHLSDFIHAAKKYDLFVYDVDEYFDEDDRDGVPRILSMVFRNQYIFRMIK
ncbi:methyltransferase domain-containing protein [Danxiaibacter flavus]|uniref:Methyltransferase domain-containing protein n=1 Tax=Danxiaibacter flavus TaxID=3049108 RepID=A0ABV3ZBQ9_9BACT|nr:methyltransferase domain-containing protein [Chitinophagaceae bacterium DXS]